MNSPIRNWLKTHVGRIDAVRTEKVQLGGSLADMAAAFADAEGTVVLLSGGSSDCARYDILAAHPWLQVKAYGRRMELAAGKQFLAAEENPFEALQILLDYFALPLEDTVFPIVSGLFGYLSYDLKNFIEKLPRTSVNDLGLPHMCLYAPSLIIVHDRTEGLTWRCLPEWAGSKPAAPDFNCSAAFSEGFSDFARESFFNRSGFTGSGFSGSGSLSPGMTKPFYLSAVAALKAYIGDGDIYQANFAQRFETDFYGSPFALFKHLFETAPAPFYAYIHAGDHHIVSTSPERFVKQTGSLVETRPIKGTRPRGSSAQEDQAMADALLESAKDDAELSMIVDLLRNDFGRVCEGGSVRVAAHKRLEAYKNVFHLVSIITGRLAKPMGCVDLIKAAFPGGSITGCPRIRAMEIIDELEPCQRHIYTGALGYISFHRSMDLSIAIRTATITGGKLLFSVGGGIVYDSVAEAEYQETLDKGRSLIEALSAEHSCSKHVLKERGIVWHNGGLVPEDSVCLPLSDLGVQYGFGFFETLRAANGVPAFLSEHVERFHNAWAHLFKTPLPDVTWLDVIEQVIAKNRLTETTAVIKLIATRGSRPRPPYDHQLIVTARPYSPRPALAEKGGLSLATYPHARHTPLADFKSLNYLYYYLAGQWAKEKSADEALILNPDGSVSESHTANILVFCANRVFSPISPHVLDGVMQQQVLKCLSRRGYHTAHRKLSPSDLQAAHMVVLTNSLIGAVPVTSLDGQKIRAYPELCQAIRREVL